jgi:peptidoglycan L-alanyl-D-glutamate endopeptidase CwlK
MNSRHITGHAIDYIAIGDDGVATYDPDDMRRVADVIKEVAADHRVNIEWGGDWKSFRDGPHFQLPWKTHPGTK